MKKIIVAILLVTMALFALASCGGEELPNYTVTFDTDGGTTVAAQTVEEGQVAIKPADPTKEGFTFAGWFVGETAYDFSSAVTANLTVKAKWTQNTYTVIFDTDGAAAIDAQTVAYGATATKPADPIKEGFTFMGWFVGDAAYDFTAPVKANVEIKAKWAEITYTVTFDTDGAEPIEAQTVAFGGTATKPADPTKEGFTFAGWTVNGEAYDFATVLTADVTIKATWAEITYTVTFDTDGAAAIDAQTVAFGGTATKPADPTKDGFYFMGWTVNGEAYDFATVLTGDITVKAEWLAKPDLTALAGKWTGEESLYGYATNEYTFVIAKEGITSAIYETSNNTIKMLVDMVKFDGATLVINYHLETAPEIKTITFKFSSENQTLATDSAAGSCALTLGKMVSVTFNYGGYDKEDTVSEVAYGTTVKKPSASWTGHNLVGWFVGETEYDFVTPVTEDMTITAKWEVKTSKVVFYGQDGTTVLKEIVVEYNTLFGDIEAPEFTAADGYKFNGKWYTSKTSTSPVSDSAKITSDKTYYPGLIAPMTDIAGTWNGTHSSDGDYTFVIDAEAATITGKLVKGEVVDELEITTIKFDGTDLAIRYFKDGANSETTLTLEFVDGTLKGYSVTLINAAQKTYTVTFDTDGGSEVKAQTVVAGQKAQKPSNPTKDGFAFVGWYIGDVEFDFDAAVEADVTVKAKWAETVTVTLDHGYNSKTETKTVAKGMAFEKPADPTRNYYDFVGWFVGDVEYDFTKTVDAPITLTAKWVGEPKTFTFCNQDGSVIKTVTVPYGETIPASEIPTTAGVNEGFVFTGIWVKGTKWLVTSAKFNFETEQIKNDTTKVFPAAVAKSIKDLAGTWTGSYSSYSGQDTYVVNIAVDENYKVTITGTYTKNGTNYEIILQSVQFDGSKMNFRFYYDGTSTKNLTGTLQEDGTLKVSSGPTLTKS